MVTFELTKIAGGVLCALLVIVGFRTTLHILEHDEGPHAVGYSLPMPQKEGTGPVPAGGAGAVDAPVDLPAIPAQTFDPAAIAEAATGADAAAGATIAKKCAACHSFDQGGPNKVGPNLWGVVGRPKGGHEGFNYSEAMKSKGGDWTPADLAAFLHKPKEFVPGTKMIFPGIKDSTDLSDLLAYLNTLK
jgi:cytochrome c